MRQITSKPGRQITVPSARVPKVSQHMDATERQQKVYSTAQWRALREAFRAAGWTQCVGCRVAAAALLDHILPIQRRPDLAFDPRNLQPMCSPCHGRKSEDIDAPGRDPSRYRSDRAHLADMRHDLLKAWADRMAPVHLEALGSFAAGSKLPSRFAKWDPVC
jgi:5-methylcytosine-specific restriction protein A